MVKVISFVLALALLAAFAVQAQDAPYPSRPFKIVVPTSAGSGSDTVARWLGEQLAAALGQPVLIDNKPGANGVIAAMAVKQAPADGYTLFLGTNTHMAVNPVVVKDLPYDSVKDFRFVSGITRGMIMFVAPPNTKLKNTADLVNAAAAKLDKPENSYPSGYGVRFDKQFQNVRTGFTVSQWQGGKLVTVFPKVAVLPGVTLKPLGRP